MADPNDPNHHGTLDENGNWIPPLIQREFLEWLTSFPRIPATQIDWCRERGVNERTARRWKQDTRFRKEWEAASHDLNISPERVQSVIDNLYDIASTSKGPAGVKAADLYLQYVDKYTPKRTLIVEDENVASMSYDDLLALAKVESTRS